jgi:D-glycero-alpha-D-manno-heptose 1-phosphate guanylyltransferase
MEAFPEMVVLCGGKGQRLGSLTTEIPKPLLPVGGAPFLLRLLLQWKKEGIQRFILSTHYLSEQFRDFAKEHQNLYKIEVVEESEPLGTGGGLKNAVKQRVKSASFLVANGDSYVSQSLSELWQFHQKENHWFTLTAVQASRVLGGAQQKGHLIINEQNEISGFSTEENIRDGWINGGIYAISKDEILTWPDGKFDLEKSILPNTTKHRVNVLKSNGILLDIGIPACYSLFDRELGGIDKLFSSIGNLENKSH